MSNTQTRVLRIFKFHRVIIPVILGLGVFLFLEFRDFNPEPYQNINWKLSSYLWIFMAVLMMVTRDLAYMYRIRLLTDKQLSWRHSFDVIMLWEFASSVTPSVVGGSAAALYIVSKEGISTGRSTAIVMITAFLDELFYITTVPVVLLLAGTGSLFTNDKIPFFFDTQLGVQGAFVAGYIFILILTTIIIYGVFIKPRGFKWFLLWVFKIKFLRKWRSKAAETGDDIIITSKEMRGKPFIFWARAYLSTFLSWTGRFWVVNFLILSITPVGDHFLIWARQLIMWVIMLISPTPGSSGVAEIIFPSFFGDFIPLGLAVAVALTWRMLSYYPYIIIGAIVLPNWIRRVYSKPHPQNDPKEN
ncbi:MAG: flippase-like domain-containing protein [Bacteroidales bacterium]|nr:flippase-like domain-containing protein [Bacteroidales bacterium]